jgi:hypothetical protein
MTGILKKYFIPNKNNDYKPHFLRKFSVSVLAGISVFLFFIFVAQGLIVTRTDLLSAVIPKALVDLTNVNRTSNNVSTLSISSVLEAAAQMKANDMAKKGYFAHTSPEGLEPWHWFEQSGYDYAYAGENLAVNFSDSIDVEAAWMKSPTHRENILNGKFTEIGIATAKGFYNGRETVFVVQMFGRPLPKPLVTVKPESLLPETTQTPAPAKIAVVEKPAPTVLSETDTFIAVENPAVEENLEVLNEPVAQNSEISPSTVLTSPQKNISTIYTILAAIIVLALLLMIFIEIRRQHPRNIIAGVLLLFLIFVLFYAYHNLFPGVVVI